MNFIYASIQLLHNLGAATVVGIPVAVWSFALDGKALQRRLVWIVACAWALQAITGVGFGAASYYFKGQLPDIEGVGLIALLTKISCVVGGLFITVTWLAIYSESSRPHPALWPVNSVLGITALNAAAFLRWYL